MPFISHQEAEEVEPRISNVSKGTRVSFLCMKHGFKFEVFLGSDGQLWRWVTPSDRLNDPELMLGQHTVASIDNAANYLASFGIKSEKRDQYIKNLRAFKSSRSKEMVA